jgi:hypothetical protein
MIEDMRRRLRLYLAPATNQTAFWDNPPPLGSTHGRGSVALTAVASRLTTAFGLPSAKMAVLSVHPGIHIPPRSMPPGYSHRNHVRMVGPSHRPLDGSTASHPPFACAIAASKRSSCARRPSSRIAARTQTTAIVSDTPTIVYTVASLVERSSLLHDKAMLVDGAVDDETVGQTSAENSLAHALGSP